MKNLFLFTITCLFFHTVFAQVNSSSPTIPFNSNAGYAYGIKPTNLPSTGVYTKSTDAYNAYINWKARFVETCSDATKARVKFDNNAQTVSEGIAYGAILAAYAADKPLFDQLLKYYESFLNGNGLMHWRINGCTTVSGSNSASDADLDLAFALLVAAKQWPNATSPYDYSSKASYYIKKNKDYNFFPVGNANQYQLKNGDSWGTSTCRNPGYQSPAYYRMFAQYQPSDADFWNNCVTKAYEMINTNRNSSTGLVSDWCDNTGTANNCNGGDGTYRYGYDACRYPWRMVVESMWYDRTESKTLGGLLASYVNTTGSTNVKGPVTQTGIAGSNSYHNSIFIGTYALGVMASNNTSYQTLLNSMYSRTVSILDGDDNAYFGTTLRALSLFVMTGNYWNPVDGGLTAVQYPDLSYNLNVYPNPTENNLTITMPETESGVVEVQDMQGRVVSQETFNNLLEIDVNVDRLVSGVYFVMVITENRRYTKKFIKK